METARPIISIIIPVYNPPREMLLRCVHSLQDAVTFVPLGSIEVIFVNDGSTNFYVDEALKNLDGCFRYFRKENGGLSSARNAGMELATGEYLMFVDADDWIEQSALLDSLRFIKESQADIIYLGYANDDQSPQMPQWQKSIEGELDIKQFIIDMTAGQAEASHHGITIYSTWAKLYKRSLIENHRLRFDPELMAAEDFWFNLCVLASQNCESLYFNNQLVYHYISNSESITRFYSDIRVRMSIVFMSRLEAFLHSDMADFQQFERAVCRQLLTSIDISMRTYFVHPLNELTLLRKCKELRSYLKEPIMQRWIQKLVLNDGRNRKEWRDIFLLKIQLYWIVLLIILAKRTIKSQIRRLVK